MSDVAPEQPQAETIELINAEISASMARQFDSGKSIDTKATVLVGYAGAAASFLATRHAQPVLAALAYVAFGMTVVLGIWAFRLRLYQDVPTPRQLFNGYIARPKAETLAALAATRVEAFESTVLKHRQKARLWQISLASLVVGMTLMVISVASVHWPP